MHVDIEPTQIGRVFAPDYGIVSDAKAALELFVEVARERRRRAAARPQRPGSPQCRERKRDHAAAHPLRQRAGQAAAGVRGDEPGFGPDTRYVSTIGLSQIAGGAVPARLPAAALDQRRPGRPAGLDRARPRSASCVADPDATVVALSGDYDFQFMIEELAVGAQFNLPYIHVLVNNAYLGLIRQSQRGFDMDYCVQLSFDNINSPGARRLRRRPRQGGRGPGLQGDPGHRAGRDRGRAFEQAKKLMAEYRVPVVVEIILERVTNISMGTELDNVVEFEELAERATRTRRPRSSRCSTSRAD